jgi:hypothetical protein
MGNPWVIFSSSSTIPCNLVKALHSSIDSHAFREVIMGVVDGMLFFSWAIAGGTYCDNDGNNTRCR